MNRREIAVLRVMGMLEWMYGDKPGHRAFAQAIVDDLASHDAMKFPLPVVPAETSK